MPKAGGDLEELVANISDVGGLAIDPLTKTLYWSEGRAYTGCGCVRSIALPLLHHVSAPLKPVVVYIPAPTDFWKGTAIAVDPARQRMYVSLQELDYSRSKVKMVRKLKNKSQQGGSCCVGLTCSIHVSLTWHMSNCRRHHNVGCRRRRGL